jgi:hypothetical protein
MILTIIKAHIAACVEVCLAQLIHIWVSAPFLKEKPECNSDNGDNQKKVLKKRATVYDARCEIIKSVISKHGAMIRVEKTA